MHVHVTRIKKKKKKFREAASCQLESVSTSDHANHQSRKSVFEMQCQQSAKWFFFFFFLHRILDFRYLFLFLLLNKQVSEANVVNTCDL